MDEIVRRAMARWPDVPNAFGWLGLDRRGEWLLKGERIAHRGVTEFIARNFASDERGRWYFQNGPQRVFVTLHAAPFVFHVSPAGELLTHTGQPAETVLGACCDEDGALYLHTAAGFGIVSDRDLPDLLVHLVGEDGETARADVLDRWLETGEGHIGFRWNQKALPLERVWRADLPSRFGFDPDPRPAEGQPEC